jgi:hypothetical protein
MSDEGGLADAEGIEDRDIVTGPGLDVIAVCRLARGQKASAGNPDDMKIIRKLEGKLIIDVCVVTQPGEQHHGLGRVRAAPVQHLKLDARFDLDERHFVWGGITACSRLRRAASGPGRLVSGR